MKHFLPALLLFLLVQTADAQRYLSQLEIGTAQHHYFDGTNYGLGLTPMRFADNKFGMFKFYTSYSQRFVKHRTVVTAGFSAFKNVLPWVNKKWDVFDEVCGYQQNTVFLNIGYIFEPTAKVNVQPYAQFAYRSGSSYLGDPQRFLRCDRPYTYFFKAPGFGAGVKAQYHFKQLAVVLNTNYNHYLDKPDDYNPAFNRRLDVLTLHLGIGYRFTLGKYKHTLQLR